MDYITIFNEVTRMYFIHALIKCKLETDPVKNLKSYKKILNEMMKMLLYRENIWGLSWNEQDKLNKMKEEFKLVNIKLKRFGKLVVYGGMVHLKAGFCGK
jgi:hypothetical protein